MEKNSGDIIDLEELRYLSLFQDLTGAMAYRCITDNTDNRVFYLVNKRDIGKAIGKDGKNVKALSKILNKEVEIVGYSDGLEPMVRNLFSGVSILKVDFIERGEQKVVYVKVSEDDKGKAIGKDGKNVKRARIILGKLFNVAKVVVK
ncbi:MAG: NusA-like transcription termination signal-binding factor [Caldisphaeraceae archaeon]|nr:NusA-like transcription termination signal-binding factor [Caldisphaeraceae archaeon]MEB3691843.1 NusA-like transcription termination signal-binding factor [Caldisphaeraceae archaeon]MEB3798109.1 NusA-like transcription termination signal-binding factor [Caldisphaeraceae archaeon]